MSIYKYTDPHKIDVLRNLKTMILSQSEYWNSLKGSEPIKWRKREEYEMLLEKVLQNMEWNDILTYYCYWAKDCDQIEKMVEQQIKKLAQTKEERYEQSKQRTLNVAAQVHGRPLPYPEAEIKSNISFVFDF